MRISCPCFTTASILSEAVASGQTRPHRHELRRTYIFLPRLPSFFRFAASLRALSLFDPFHNILLSTWLIKQVAHLSVKNRY